MPSSPDSLTPEQIRELEKKAAEADEAERKARERGMAWLAETKEVRVSPPQEFVDAFDEWCKVDAVERDIQELEMVKPVGVTEILAQRQALSELNAERARLLALLDGRESPPEATPASELEPQATRIKPEPAWIDEARKVAKAYMTDRKSKDLHPTQWHVAQHVEEVLRNRKVYGPSGAPVSAAYIKRHALGPVKTARAMANQQGQDRANGASPDGAKRLPCET